MKLYIKSKFVDPIVSGTCIHLIGNLLDVDNDDYFTPGVRLELVKKNDVNAPADVVFANKVISGTQSIYFKWFQIPWGKKKKFKWLFELYIDGESWSTEPDALLALAKNAGFKTVNEFLNYDLWHHKKYHAKIIHFTDFRYVPSKNVVAVKAEESISDFDRLISLSKTSQPAFLKNYHLLTDAQKNSFNRHCKNNCAYAERRQIIFMLMLPNPHQKV